MNISLNRETELQTVSKITIYIGEVEYEITEPDPNKKELLIRKFNFGIGGHDILIKPVNSNVMLIK
jgi:hypothetical protein